MSTTKEINANYLANLFEEEANKILAKEKATAKRKAKKTTVEKAEITEKAEKPKTVKKATKTVKKTADKVENSEKSQSTEKPKKVVKKATKTVKKTADKEPKKTTKKAKAEEVEQAEIRKLDSLKIAKVTYERVDNINSYDELSKAIEKGDDIYVAFDISSVKPSEYENIFHVPFSKDMKDNFDICQPIFICDKNPRLIFASLYTEALWDLFPDEFDLLSAVLIEKQPTKKTKK
uniref:Uncharacterized protein n=1 Tax=Myoviridae sp. ctZgq1 TaxID=2826666 RepID=A0A8S5LXB7_9CAUD|nr:MAG TPA: hypothetical protein [Myoviridae sp. ctZgq1]